MKEEIIRCPICSKIVALSKNGMVQKLEEYHGICWGKIGYSIGGWGQRNDFMGEFSGEVCGECFAVLKTKINELNEAIQQRKGSCDEGVCIYRTQQDKATRDYVSDVQQNKLQP